MCMCFAYTCVSAPRACLVSSEVRRVCWVSRAGVTKGHAWIAMWVLGTKPQHSARASGALNRFPPVPSFDQWQLIFWGSCGDSSVAKPLPCKQMDWSSSHLHKCWVDMEASACNSSYGRQSRDPWSKLANETSHINSSGFDWDALPRSIRSKNSRRFCTSTSD